MPEGFGKRILQILFYLLVMALALFLTAGRLRWSAAWLFLGLAFTGIIITGTGLLLRNAGLITERTQVGTDTETWDKIIVGFYGFFGFLVLIVAGLDTRLLWSTPLPSWVMWPTGLGFFMGNLFASRAMWANAYFATTVRIQENHGHAVITTGPYSRVRHPGYSGWLVSQVCIPLLLGSILALIPAVLAVLFLIWRTAKEDRFLKQNLVGYSDYAQAVRYRLVPGLW